MVKPQDGGLYWITNVASRTRLDLNNGNSDNGTKVQGWDGGDIGNQKWGFRFYNNSGGSDWFVIYCWATQTVLDLDDGSNRNGTAVHGWHQAQDNSSIRNQLWRVIDQGDDRYRLRNMASNTDLDLNNGSNTNGTQVQGWFEGNTDAQRWRFQDVDGSQYLNIGEGAWDLIDFNDKANRCRQMIDRAKQDRNEKHCYGVAFNMSRFGLYDPTDAQRILSAAIDDMLKPENIGVNGQYRIGTVNFDYYERNMGSVRNVIRSNRGCGNIQ